MTNWYYYNNEGKKNGPVTQSALKEFASRGIITPNTPLETDTGHKGLAGQVSGLFNVSSQSTVNQATQQSVPIASEQRGSIGAALVSAIYSAMRSTMQFIGAIVGFIMALALTGVVVFLLWWLVWVMYPEWSLLKKPPGPDKNPDDVIKQVPPKPPDDEKERMRREEEKRIRREEEKRIRREEQIQAAKDADKELRHTLLLNMAPINQALQSSGFRDDSLDINFQNYANFGTATLRERLRAATDNKGNPYEQDKVKQIQNDIVAQRGIITDKAFGLADLTYTTPDKVKVDGTQSSIDIHISVPFRCLQFGNLDIAETETSVPQTMQDDVSVTHCRFTSKEIILHVEGLTTSIRQLDEHKSDYRVCVYFTHLRSDKKVEDLFSESSPPAAAGKSSSFSKQSFPVADLPFADVLRIAIIKTR